jgi:hypothetical protein
MFTLKNYFTLAICLVLAIQTINTTSSCASGEVKCTSGQCDSPAYIEGCQTYKSKT